MQKSDVGRSLLSSGGEEQSKGQNLEKGLTLAVAVPSPPASHPVRFVAPSDADSLVDALVAGQLSPRTRLAYASDLTELLAVMEAWNLQIADVNRDHLHAYRRWLAGEAVPGLERKDKPCAVATISRKISVCRQLFAEALDKGLIEVNPAARLRGLTVSQESKTLGLSKTQAKDLLEKIETKTLLGLRDKAMLSLMIRTGLRRMDIIGATLGKLGERDGHTVLTMRLMKLGVIALFLMMGLIGNSTSHAQGWTLTPLVQTSSPLVPVWPPPSGVKVTILPDHVSISILFGTASYWVSESAAATLT